MTISIYQINLERDTERVAFLGLDQLARLYGKTAINGSIYDEVFYGDVDAETLEDVFGMFNLRHPEGYTGRSLSVSDVVEIIDGSDKNGCFFCDTVGFQEVQFELGKEPLITMSRPEWGLYPQKFRPRIYWGARAIITSGVVDLLPDRQSFTTHPSVDKDEKAEFVAWLDKQALPYLNQRLKERDTAHVEFASRYNRYLCIAEDRSSGGYLYIGAYTRK